MIKYIINELEKNQIIAQNMSEIYSYGLTIIFLKCTHVLFFITFGIVNNIGWEMFFFLIFFSEFRQYCGGFHAKTSNRCFLITIIVSVLFKVYCILNLMALQMLVISIISMTVIFVVGPVDTFTKQFSQNDIIKYEKKIKILMPLFLVLVIVMYILLYRKSYLVGFSYACFIQMIFSLCGIIKKRRG